MTYSGMLGEDLEGMQGYVCDIFLTCEKCRKPDNCRKEQLTPPYPFVYVTHRKVRNPVQESLNEYA